MTARRVSRPEWNRRKPTLREAALTAHEDAGEGVRRMVFSLPRWEGMPPEPGQFVMVQVSRSQDPLLGRPFGVAGFTRRGGGADLELWVRLAGRGTSLMGDWSVGDRVSLSGPLGTGFPLPREGRRAVLAAGGIGLPPLLFLARILAERGMAAPLALYGAGTRRSLAGLEALEQTGAEVLTATEDGSHGERGLVTDLLAPLDLREADLYACGPAAMLAAVWRGATGRSFRSFFSLEARMACGFGVCAGCAVRVRPPDGGPPEAFAYQRACREGPVFPGDVLVEESFLSPAGGPGGCRGGGAVEA